MVENGSYRWPLIFSVLLHFILLAFLIINLSDVVNYSVSEKSDVSKNYQVIQAAVVNSQSFNKAPPIRPFRPVSKLSPPGFAKTPGFDSYQTRSAEESDAFSASASPPTRGEGIPKHQAKLKESTVPIKQPVELAKPLEHPLLESRKAVAVPTETAKQIIPEKKPVPVKQIQATNNKLKQAMERDLQKQLAQEMAEQQLSEAVERESKLPPKILTRLRHPHPPAEEANLPETKEGDGKSASPPMSSGEIDKYKALIIQAISQHWLIPDDISPGLSCELFIRVSSQGDVLSVDISRSSGDVVLDRSARAAVFKATPLPIPKEAEVFDKFRELRLTVRPENVM